MAGVFPIPHSPDLARREGGWVEILIHPIPHELVQVGYRVAMVPGPLAVFMGGGEREQFKPLGILGVISPADSVRWMHCQRISVARSSRRQYGF